MIIKTGIDLVYLPKFKASLKRGGEIFLRRIFNEEELTIDKARGGKRGRAPDSAQFVDPKDHLERALAERRSKAEFACLTGVDGKLLTGPRAHAEHLAGIFAAKEAIIKALSLPIDSWHDIHISHQSNGALQVQISNFKFQISNSSLSISHDGNYVIAQYTAILKQQT